MTPRRHVVVKHLPERLHLRGAQELRRELEPTLNSDRPLIVFDFARVRQMDGAGIELLVECLDAVMKRDGDIKLAGVPPELCVILELTRVDRFFEMFDNAEAAVRSFQQFTAQDIPSPQAEDLDVLPKQVKPNGHFKLAS